MITVMLSVNAELSKLGQNASGEILTPEEPNLKTKNGTGSHRLEF